VQELDISLLRIRDVGTIFAAAAWPHLRELDVCSNLLTSLAPLRHLPALRVLAASANRLGASGAGVFEPDQQATDAGDSDASLPSSIEPPRLPNLEVLQLGDNRLTSMDAAQARRLPALRSLFLQGNAIQRLSGVSGLSRLEELVRSASARFPSSPVQCTCQQAGNVSPAVFSTVASACLRSAVD
jgi:Leucine rich repeat